MDTTVKTFEYTPENLAYLKSRGFLKSATSKPYSLNKVIRASFKRGVYWFTDKWVAKKIDNEMYRMGVRTICII